MERRTRQADGHAARKARRGPRRGQEHHRLRRVRRPGGIDGLLHITDMAWRRAPSERGGSGRPEPRRQSILSSTPEKNRVSLGIKQLGDDPWLGVSRRYPNGHAPVSKITNIADYGGVRRDRSPRHRRPGARRPRWTGRTRTSPRKIVTQLGEEVEVMVLDTDDEDTRRISLGMKQCKPNPWGSPRRQRGDRVKGPIKFDHRLWRVRRPGGRHRRPPLVHLSDLSWSEAPAGPPCATTEGPGGRGESCSRIDRRRARAHLAGHQAARRDVHEATRPSMTAA